MPNQENLHKSKLIPIYTTRGDVGGFLLYPYIYSAQGEWIGWVNSDRLVYSVHGSFVGSLGSGPRILRKREVAMDNNIQEPPPPPPPIRPPSHVPLPPQMPEVQLNFIDVLDEAPELLPPADFGEMLQDMD